MRSVDDLNFTALTLQKQYESSLIKTEHCVIYAQSGAAATAMTVVVSAASA